MRTIFLLLISVFASATSVRAALLHRWSFNDAAGSPAPGTIFTDTVSSMEMTLRGNGATLDGTRISLPGSTLNGEPEATISAYLDLPNGIVSSKTNLTIEIWAAPLGARQWEPLFDFGRWNNGGDGLGALGEWTGASADTPPGGVQSDDALSFLLTRNADLNTQRTGVTLNEVRVELDTNLPTTAGVTYHYVVTVADGVGAFGASGMQLALYRDGVLAGTLDVPHRLNVIEDVNCWLGRLQWNSLSTSNVAYDEVRIYDHALTPAEIAASLAAGPNPAPPTAQADAATMHLGQKVRVDVLANDTGVILPDSLTVVTPPASGSAVVSGGQILYTHTTGVPVSDSFTYRVSGPGGDSADTAVNIAFSNSLRIPNSTLNVPSEPPATTYTTVPAFGALTFNQPINLATVPGDAQRIFVVQRPGFIRVIPSVTAPVPSASVFLDLAALCTSRGETLLTNVDRGLMSMAFHPQHAANRRFFVFYSVAAGGQNYYRISRFEAQAGNPNAADTTSEVVLIQQLEPNGFHLGTDMHFGTDGYLYVSTGDGGGQNDQRRYGQRIDLDFHCALLRLDVDKLPGNPEPNLHASVPTDGGVARYSVPAGNPFVTANPNVVFNGESIPAATVRTEFFSVGLRNPFRFSVDAPTGEIWIGDVGQLAREEINLATNGANFGWSWREGTIAGPNAGEALPGFTYDDPLYEYVIGSGPMQGHSVTGGIVYRGANLPGLTGAYIFGDYQDGNIWSLRRTPSVVVERLTGNNGFVAFRADPSNGDVLAADIQEGRIYRLVAGSDTGGFPATLSATGLFADLTDLAPAPGVLPYFPNLAFWSDYAIKRRWFVIPDAVSTMTWSRDDNWTFPDGTIWVKHFDLELERGNPATAQRVETRLLVKNAAGVYGVSYRWNAEQTEATLVADAGADFDIDVLVGELPQVQHYRIPSRSECLSCHNPPAGHALSFSTRQLNRTESVNNFIGNQLTLLHNAGYFANSPDSPNLLPRHVRADETQFPAEARVRSYLDVNCANCHRAGGSAPATWDGSAPLTLAQTLLINGTAIQSGADPLNRLIVPGDTTHSIVLNRVALTNGFTRMPPLGSNELDPGAIALLTEWINALPSQQTYAQWRVANFGNDTDPEGAPDFDADGDEQDNRAEFLAGTSPLDGGSKPQTEISTLGPNIVLTLDLPPNRSFQVETTTDLITWSLWDVPGNGGVPTPGGPVTLMAPLVGDRQFFRAVLWEN